MRHTASLRRFLFTALPHSPFVDVGVVLARDRVLGTPEREAFEVDQAGGRPLEEGCEHDIHQAHLGAEEVLGVEERGRAR